MIYPNIYLFDSLIFERNSLLTANVWKNFSDNDSQKDLPSFCLLLWINFLSSNSFICSYALEPLRRMRSDCKIFFLMAITASVLKTAVFNSAGSKSSTNSFKLCFNSKDIDDLFSFILSADFESEYFLFSSSMEIATKFISALVISDKFFLKQVFLLGTEQLLFLLLIRYHQVFFDLNCLD